MKKSAFSALELLIIIVVLCFCCLIFWNKNTNPVKSAVQQRKELKTKQEIINSKLDEIQKIKDMRDENSKQTMEQY